MKLIFLVFVILPCFIEAIGIEHEKIIKWWSEISVKKPLKCKINAEYLKPLPNKVRKITNGLIQIPYLKIKPCSVEDTIFVPFEFKGNITNGKIHGPGKLRFLDEKPTKYRKGLLKEMNKTCIRNNFNIKEVVGTFVNGMISNQAKVVFKNGDIIISSFLNGNPNGPKRLWKKSEQNLSRYSFC